MVPLLGIAFAIYLMIDLRSVPGSGSSVLAIGVLTT